MYYKEFIVHWNFTTYLWLKIFFFYQEILCAYHTSSCFYRFHQVYCPQVHGVTNSMQNRENITIEETSHKETIIHCENCIWIWISFFGVFFFFFFFFLAEPMACGSSKPGIEPTPQQQPKLLHWKSWILNWLSHQGTPEIESALKESLCCRVGEYKENGL